MRSLSLFTLLALFLTSCPASVHRNATAPSGSAGEITLFLTTELRGQLEPCGCNSEPLGGLSRLAALLRDAARERGVLFLDGGSTLFSEAPAPPELLAQEKRKAELIRTVFKQRLHVQALGLGPFDLPHGVGEVRLPRQAANVDPAAGIPLEPPKLLDVKGLRVGVFGVVDPDLVRAAGVRASEPAEAARAAISQLRGEGAQLLVALAHMPREKARTLAREAPGADFILIGYGAADPAQGQPPSLEPEKLGTTWLVQPASKGQMVIRLDVGVDAAGGALTDALGEKRARARLEALAERIARQRQDLATWQKDPSADPTFLSTRRAELTRLEQERASLEAHPVRKPPRGSWFVLELIPIKRALRCDTEVQQAKQTLELEIARTNLEAARDERTPPVPAGAAGFVGDKACMACHPEAGTAWRKTKHAEAWATLTQLNRHYDRSCVGCHVTGWAKPGGSTLAKSEHLRSVQCEACHGPGSRHVETAGNQRETLVVRPEASLCLTCHTLEHSDTFQYEAYLRDVTGEGHGDALRRELGEGPTGYELRQAALKKAGAALGEGCAR